MAWRKDVCHCRGNTGFQPEYKGQFFFSKHVYKYIAFNAIYFVRHTIIALESECLMAIKLSTDLFQFCEKANLYRETFSGLWKAICSPMTCCNEGHFWWIAVHIKAFRCDQDFEEKNNIRVSTSFYLPQSHIHILPLNLRNELLEAYDCYHEHFVHSTKVVDIPYIWSWKKVLFFPNPFLNIELSLISKKSTAPLYSLTPVFIAGKGNKLARLSGSSFPESFTETMDSFPNVSYSETEAMPWI